MRQYTIQVSEITYQLLTKQASIEDSTPKEVVERLLVKELTSLHPPSDDILQTSSSPENTNEALAAVHRLTSLFADVTINHLEQALNDPMLELANVDLDIKLL